jgi:photosystem II stability/assembly factor-like uncharacterized protein
VLLLALIVAPGQSDEKATTSSQPALGSEWIKPLTWRPIGPASMGGRITAISVCESDPSTYWIATASGGLLKTTNNGINFRHQFDHEATVSIGDVCVAPSDKNVVWIGTGENNPRNSVSYGDGVYKSTDGGQKWENMGLKQSFQIGKILIHPKNPDVVYVGALGRLYGPNEERGLFKTTDGGKSWQRILYVDDKTGVIDMRMNPADPETLVVATWERQRDEFDAFFNSAPGSDNYGPVKTYAPGTALYKTTDGGGTFKKLTQGLPTAKMGRIGLDWYAKDPHIVYAIIQTEKSGTGSEIYLGERRLADAPGGARLIQLVNEGPADKAGLKAGDVVTALDGQSIKGAEELIKQVADRKDGDKVKLTVQRGNEKKEVTVALGKRPRGGGQGGGFLTAGFRGEDVEDGFRVSLIAGEPGDAAAKAGLKEGDLVTAIDGKPASSFQDTFMELSQSHMAGDKIKVTVSRGPQRQDIELTLAAGAFGRGGRGGGAGGGGGGGGRGGRGQQGPPYGSSLGGQQENSSAQQGSKGDDTGGVYRSNDFGDTWVRINSINPRPMYFSQIRVDPSDNNHLYVLGVSMYHSTDGAKHFSIGGSRGVHSDQHALWIDPKDGRHMVIGCDGGYYVTYDRGSNWDHLNTMAIGQFYHVDVDPRRNYRVYGGLQDNGSWGGPSMTRSGQGPINEDWIGVGGGDGFVCRVDPKDPDVIYSESQGGNMQRIDLRTGQTLRIRPADEAGQGPGQAQAEGEEKPQKPGERPRHRFNWNTPFILSRHNSGIFYCAGEKVFRSVEGGKNLEPISDVITATDKGSGTAVAESPVDGKIIWAGTDDGALWVTNDYGKKWTNVAKNVKLPKPFWVATIEPSRYKKERAYVAFDAHRSDDDNPYIYVTEDLGETWKPLRGNLPMGSSRVLREDIQNPNLLYLGTEFAVWASLDHGKSWTKINNNLPTVAVHELCQHPTSGEIVAATHGRSIWIMDVSPLRQMKPETLEATAYLYKPTSAVSWARQPRHAGTNRRFVGRNPDPGTAIYFSLTKKPEKISLKIVDIDGKTVRDLTQVVATSTEPGLHRVAWDLSRTPAAGGGRGGRGGGARGGAGRGGEKPELKPGAEDKPGAEQAAAPRGGGGRGLGFGFGGPPVSPGEYRVVLTVDGKELTQTVRVDADPDVATNAQTEGSQPIDDDADDDDDDRADP